MSLVWRSMKSVMLSKAAMTKTNRNLGFYLEATRPYRGRKDLAAVLSVIAAGEKYLKGGCNGFTGSSQDIEGISGQKQGS